MKLKAWSLKTHALRKVANANKIQDPQKKKKKNLLECSCDRKQDPRSQKIFKKELVGMQPVNDGGLKWDTTSTCENEWENTPDNLKIHNIKTSGQTVSARQDRKAEGKITPFTPLRERKLHTLPKHSEHLTTAYTHAFFSEKISRVTIRMRRAW